ncbi:hypothetical protein ID866_944 [Astraeus odoratus]|nr:hypothetical protein ID866_944 [Astraeus odoratus]
MDNASYYTYGHDATMCTKVAHWQEDAAPTIPKRTRSQMTASDEILRVPLSRSPLKDARAHARAQGQSTSSRQRLDRHLQPHSPAAGVESELGSGGEPGESRGGLQPAEGKLDACTMKECGEASPGDYHVSLGENRTVDISADSSAAAMHTKKRASPDTEPARLTSPRMERTPKRAKLEAMKVLSRGVEEPPATEYDVPLRDDDTSPKKNSRRFVRAASVVSPSRTAPIFPSRAKSVPLEGENVVPSLDLTALPPSPRRSPCRTSVQIKRAPSQPPPDADMDIDSGEPSFTDFGQFTTPRKFPAFNYTVNFATPMNGNKHTGQPLMTPLSPLTPLPPTPFLKRLPGIRSSTPQTTQLEQDMDASGDTLINTQTSPTNAPCMLESMPLMPREPSQHPSPDGFRSPSVASSLTELSSIDETPDPPGASQELMPPPPVPESRQQERTPSIDTGSSTNLGKAGAVFPASTITNASSVLPSTSIPPITKPTAAPHHKRATIIGAMKPKAGSSAGPRRLTRSSSVKEKKADTRQDAGATKGSHEVSDLPSSTPSTLATNMTEPLSSALTSTKFQPTNVTSKPKPPVPPKCPSSSSSSLPSIFPLQGVSKLKQTSLNAFMKPKAIAGTSTTTIPKPADISTSTATSSSKAAPHPSPSKIPLPVSPLKHASGKTRAFTFTGTSSNAGIFGGTLRGRTLSTLSHALEKLDVPPPSRPNTSLGFSRDDSTHDGDDGVSDGGQNEPEGGEKSIQGVDKGKAKTRDDSSLPTVAAASNRGTGFARPTASSLKRAVTVSGPATGQSSILAGMQKRLGAGNVAGTARGRGTVGIFGRAGERASKNPSLPSVAGSPAKGPRLPESRIPASGPHRLERESDDGEVEIVESSRGEEGASTGEEPRKDPCVHSSAKGTPDTTRENTNTATADEDLLVTSPSSSANKKTQRTGRSSSLLTLNPASAALHALSESLSSLPQTPPPSKPRAMGTRQGLRSASAATNKGSPGSGSNATNQEVISLAGSSSSANGSVVNSTGSGKKSSLKVLKKCAIFVDIVGRVCQSCTHIVYKNGLPNTLTRYRCNSLLDDPKPHVVGIAWVVECVEQRAKLDEQKYKVDVDVIDVVGGNKRRRSMLPRHLIPHSPAGPGAFSVPANMSSEADEEDTGTGDTDGSPSQDADVSMRSRDEDDLPPLERARRRRSILPGGQTSAAFAEILGLGDLRLCTSLPPYCYGLAMGVHGLTTYLHENQRVLSKTVHFPILNASNDVVTTIVVDGWSFIYEVYHQSHLPWVYGGEYVEFSRYIEQIILSWIAVGLKVYFVLDGPTPELKTPTLISRLSRSNVEQSLLFFRTSPTSRSTPRFLRETRILPPLAYKTCVQTLQRLASSGRRPLEVHFADEEADPYAVELAGRLGAYVVGNDSDFVIFNSGHYAGYMALDDMLWTAPVTEEGTDDTTKSDRDDEFRAVVHSKTKNRATRQIPTYGLIPPSDVSPTDLVLSASVYTPAALASHLKIPVTILPLLASLVGNDFSNKSTTQRNVQSLFFERSLSLSQRITHTAKTLSSILNAASQQRKARHQVGSVMDLIDRAVNALLVRAPSHMGSGEVDAIVERIVNAALQYAIDKYDGGVYGPASIWPTQICALHSENTCPFAAFFARALSRNAAGVADSDANVCEADNRIKSKLGAMYVEAYRMGKLSPKITDIVSSGTFWPTIFLENPDFETVAKSIGRPVRQWIYALLEDAVGLPEVPSDEAVPLLAEETKGRDSCIDNDEDPDELIDVVEEYSSDENTDLLAPLRDELERLRGADDSASEVPTLTSVSSRSRARASLRVLEYVRRGTRITPEEVAIPDLKTLLLSSGFNDDAGDGTYLPFQLRSLEERMSLFLHILKSDVPGIRDLPPDVLLGVLVVRWVAHTLHIRAVETGAGTARDNERWTYREARAFLYFFIGSPKVDNSGRIINATSGNAYDDTMPREDAGVPIRDRNVQLMAQSLMAIQTIQDLSQVLFLSEQVPLNVERLSGLDFHACLSRSDSPVDAILPKGMWEVCIHSLGHAFREEKPKKNKRKVNNATRDNIVKQSKPGPTKAVVRNRGGLFGLLADAEA